jgi:hypothetical protein
MKLFAVAIGGVYPPQCVNVFEREESARRLSEHLNATVQNVAYVEQVDSFFPSHMTQADSAWLVATDRYMQGCHINTSGDPA